MRDAPIFTVTVLLCAAGPLAAQEGKPLVFEGRLSKDDPRDAVRKQSGHKVHEVKLEAGQCYQIDLHSTDFDPFLRLEDGKKRQLAFNDDLDPANGVLDARVCFAPFHSGGYRLIVTSVEPGDGGAYTLRVEPLAAAGEPYVQEGRLAKGSPANRGQYYAAAPRRLEAGRVYVVDAESKGFDPLAIVADARGNTLAGGDAALRGEGKERLVFVPPRGDTYVLVATTATKGEMGAYTLRVREFRPSGTEPPGGLALQAAQSRGNALWGKGRHAEAAREFEVAFRLAEKADGGEGLLTARLASSLGVAYWEQGRYAEAEPLFRRALTIREAKLGRAHRDTTLAILNLATVYRDQGRYAEAEPLVRRSLAVREAKLGKDHPETAHSLDQLGMLCLTLGRYAEADALLQRALAIREAKLGKDHPATGVTADNLATLRQEQGRYAEAGSLRRRALAIAETSVGKDHPRTASRLNNLAELYRAEGRCADAEPLYLRALAILEAKSGKDHPDAATVLNNLAEAYRNLERYADAEPLHKRALAIREAKYGKDHPVTAISHNNLAVLYAAQGRYAEAESLCKQALRILETRLGKDHPNTAHAVNHLAVLYMNQGRYAEAEPLLRRALAIEETKRGKDDPATTSVRANLATALAAEGGWEEALRLTDRARRSHHRFVGSALPVLPEADQLDFLRSRLQGHFHAALSVGLSRRGDGDARARSAAWLLNGRALAQQALAEQTVLRRDSRGTDWEPLARELSDVRRRLAALAHREPRPAAATAHRQSWNELAERELDLARRVAQHSRRADGTWRWVETADVQKVLPADAALVEIARFKVFHFRAKDGKERWQPARYVAWVVHRDAVHVVELDAADRIDKAVAAARAALHQALRSVGEEGEPDAEKLLKAHLGRVADLVLKPLLPYLKDKARWLLVPDGSLWLVPWAALPLPAGKYVVERHTVSHLVSGRDLVAATEAKPGSTAVAPAGTPRGGRPVVLADPDFDLTPATDGQAGRPPGEGEAVGTRHALSLGKVRFARLPGAAAEARRIAPRLKQYAGTAPLELTGAAATEAAFRGLKGPKVLVLSTHGFFLRDIEHPPEDAFASRQRAKAGPEENPLLRCGLALAGANRRAEAKAGQDDGLLTALEVLDADLRGCELVVLSACETGLGEVRNGEGVAGLRQAFQLAGAQSVLATLWQIPDRQTAQLMGRFFDHLAASRGRADALRLAQLEMIRTRRQREGAAHPFYWAAFTLTGNWR